VLPKRSSSGKRWRPTCGPRQRNCRGSSGCGPAAQPTWLSGRTNFSRRVLGALLALLVDTSGLVALLRAGDRYHRACKAALEREQGPLVLIDFVIPEVDYLLMSHGARAAEEAFLDSLTDGTFERESLDDTDLIRATDVIRRYRDLDVGIVGAGLVAVAERRNIDRVLTLDLRHFRTFRMWGKKPFVIVPIDGDEGRVRRR